MVSHFLHLTVPATLMIFGFGGFLVVQRGIVLESFAACGAHRWCAASRFRFAGWVSVIASGDQTDRGLAGRK